MGIIKTIPSIVVHQIDNGGDLTGTLPDGTDSEETLRRGRIRYYKNCTNGGKFELPDQLIFAGFRIERISWNLPGITGVDAYIFDPDGYAYPVGSASGAKNFIDWRSGGVLVPGYAGWYFAAVKQGGAITADGSLMMTLAKGWSQSTFSQVKEIGREEKPPSMDRA